MAGRSGRGVRDLHSRADLAGPRFHRRGALVHGPWHAARIADHARSFGRSGILCEPVAARAFRDPHRIPVAGLRPARSRRPLSRLSRGPSPVHPAGAHRDRHGGRRTGQDTSPLRVSRDADQSQGHRAVHQRFRDIRHRRHAQLGNGCDGRACGAIGRHLVHARQPVHVFGAPSSAAFPVPGTG